jgi:arylsulfatase A-like enzyme
MSKPTASSLASTPSAAERRGYPLAFAAAGGAVGLVLGLVEAGLLDHIPRFAGLVRPDVNGGVWVIAPLADAPLFALVFALLGWLSGRRRGLTWRVRWAAAGAGLVSAYLGELLLWFRVWTGYIVPRPFTSLAPFVTLLFTPGLYFVIGFVLTELFLRWRWRWRGPAVLQPRRWRWLALADLAVLAALSLALAFLCARPASPAGASLEAPPAGVPRPNIVLIVMDTVRADHLSCYGYARPTTPNLDRLAARGVLFERAIAPASWTLPSLSSMLTGLLPHQHGASWGRALDPQPVTLAEILGARGYETAAFNANEMYGLAGWRLDRGFDLYDDASLWLRHDLAATLTGQSVYQALFQAFVRFNTFDHFNAGQMNRQVFEWLRHRSGRPFFLFINYNDAHRPYLPPAPYDHRFGRIPQSTLWNVAYSLPDGRPHRPLTPTGRQALIDGYDNSLDYLDAQIGRLLEAVAASPEAGRTYVLVAADHGEGFGEHGTYDHGWNLYREVLHVPLLVTGPGIPAGRHVTRVVPLGEIFSTVVQLALGDVGEAVTRSSLSRFWQPPRRGVASLPVASELSFWKHGWRREAVLSLREERWHYLLGSGGHTELYDVESDAMEKNNLAGTPEFAGVARRLQSELQSMLARSEYPWRNVDYLSPLDQPDLPFYRRVATNPDAFTLVGWPLGSAQAFFERSPSRPEVRPNLSQQDLLRSLPYH